LYQPADTACRTRRQEVQQRAPSAAGGISVIPGYRFLQTIARSPKSEIHVAHSQELGHNVAIKVLRTGPLSESPAGEEERFERERDLLMRPQAPLDRRRVRLGPRRRLPLHRHRVLPSGSLELRIRNLMTVKDSVDIFLQIAGALVVVHSAGLCHRDLKPANVMMRQDGRIVADRLRPAKRQ
jgi:serine/threonine-protein kinase